MLTEWVKSTLDRLSLPDFTTINLEMMGFDFRFVLYALVFLGALMVMIGLLPLRAADGLRRIAPTGNTR